MSNDDASGDWLAEDVGTCFSIDSWRGVLHQFQKRLDGRNLKSNRLYIEHLRYPQRSHFRFPLETPLSTAGFYKRHMFIGMIAVVIRPRYVLNIVYDAW